MKYLFQVKLTLPDSMGVCGWWRISHYACVGTSSVFYLLKNQRTTKVEIRSLFQNHKMLKYLEYFGTRGSGATYLQDSDLCRNQSLWVPNKWRFGL